ncbi:MAG: SpoIIE family protein phosphatase [Oscillospiraceae bacterium]|jgi:sigma-B regulation protein RsbU (phosphoserine phosphatase)|nr:SpoIIE family protein phosphatase [Oscillospiraceae bacterium]
MIRKQITAAFLIVSLISLLISGVISFFSLSNVRSITESAIVETAHEHLQTLANETSRTIDRRLKKYGDELLLMAHYVAGIYQSPGDYPQVSVPHARQVHTDEPTLHYYMDAGAKENPEKIQLLGNAERVFAAMIEIFPEISSIYLVDAEGINLDYDAAAISKLRMLKNGFVATQRDWYTNARDTGALVISDVYNDAGGRGLTVTFSAPIYADGSFMGVLGLNIPMDALNEKIASVAVGESGKAELLTDGGVPTAQEGFLAATARLTLTDWTVRYSVPESEVTEPVSAVDSRIFRSIMLFVALLAAIVAITTLAASAFAKRIAVPLTATAVEKERISAELGVATNIQASMLPHIFPAFPHRKDIELFGLMEPAKEVGGDFYDFFFVDENRLALIIADVSGKGVPAALFMVIAKTLLKNYAQMGKPPKEVFETVNNILRDNNSERLFVTCFMGYLDLTTGELISVNAGHNPPLLRRDGKWEFYKTRRSLVLAGRNDTKYTESVVTLRAGDELFLYTDGITEANDRQLALFGEKRLLEAANAKSALEPHDFCNAIRADVSAFSDGAEQADDITMLMIKYIGKQEADKTKTDDFDRIEK